MAEYLDLVGKPWERWATGPDFYDCAGVCAEYLRRMGCVVPIGAFQSPDSGHWDSLDATDLRRLEPGDVVLSRADDDELHVEVRLATRDPLTLTSTKTHGVLTRRLLAVSNPIGVYRLRTS